MTGDSRGCFVFAPDVFVLPSNASKIPVGFSASRATGIAKLLNLRVTPARRLAPAAFGAGITRQIPVNTGNRTGSRTRRDAPSRRAPLGLNWWVNRDGPAEFGRKEAREFRQLAFPSQSRARCAGRLAVREGFEPSIGFHLYTRSRRAPSTTRPPHPERAHMHKCRPGAEGAEYRQARPGASGSLSRPQASGFWRPSWVRLC